MRVVFAGTPEFAAVSLRALLQSRHQVVLVLTQPDRPAGRGLELNKSAVKKVAEAAGIAVQQPATLRQAQGQEELTATAADAFVVAAYGLLLPPAVLALPRLGCINVHASLLPRWRGAAPIQRALLSGDTETGISIMRMDAGLDTGPVYRREAIAMGPRDTAGSLHDRLAVLGAKLLSEVLDRLAIEPFAPQPQPDAGVTYAAKLKREECEIDWSRPAAEIDRLIRALDPAPGAFTSLQGQLLKIWAGEIESGSARAEPGEIVSASEAGIEVACGENALRITVLQLAGARRLDAGRFVRGHPVPAGTKLGS